MPVLSLYSPHFHVYTISMYIPSSYLCLCSSHLMSILISFTFLSSSPPLMFISSHSYPCPCLYHPHIHLLPMIISFLYLSHPIPIPFPFQGYPESHSHFYLIPISSLSHLYPHPILMITSPCYSHVHLIRIPMFISSPCSSYDHVYPISY